MQKKPNRRLSIIGSLNPNWKGGKRLDKDGYVLMLDWSNTNCDSHGYVREHRSVVENHIGRSLNKGEVVHHINGVKHDNRIENLELMSANEHMSHHTSQRDSKIDKECMWCSKEFRVFPSRSSRKFCSYVCMGKYSYYISKKGVLKNVKKT
jgi:hypothetical protein